MHTVYLRVITMSHLAVIIMVHIYGKYTNFKVHICVITLAFQKLSNEKSTFYL